VIQQPAHSTVRIIDHPDYGAAKSGDVNAAAIVVVDIIDHRGIERLRALIGNRKPTLVAVHAEEATGRNKLPMAYAEELGYQFGLEVDVDIVQANRPERTGQDAVHRLAQRAEFDGPVKPGSDYVLVDDAVTQGGTLADLRSYIELRGGNVIGATTLIGAPDSHILAPRPRTLAALREKLPSLERWWIKAYGHGLDALTESEAQALRRFDSTDAIRDRLAARG